MSGAVRAEETVLHNTNSNLTLEIQAIEDEAKKIQERSEYSENTMATQIRLLENKLDRIQNDKDSRVTMIPSELEKLQNSIKNLRENIDRLKNTQRKHASETVNPTTKNNTEEKAIRLSVSLMPCFNIGQLLGYTSYGFTVGYYLRLGTDGKNLFDMGLAYGQRYLLSGATIIELHIAGLELSYVRQIVLLKKMRLLIGFSFSLYEPVRADITQTVAGRSQKLSYLSHINNVLPVLGLDMRIEYFFKNQGALFFGIRGGYYISNIGKNDDSYKKKAYDYEFTLQLGGSFNL
jgi:hypothetical protein